MGTQLADYAPATALHPTADTPAWDAFLRVMEQRYARVAAARGERCVRLTAAERRAVARVAADTGLHPTYFWSWLVGEAPSPARQLVAISAAER